MSFSTVRKPEVILEEIEKVRSYEGGGELSKIGQLASEYAVSAEIAGRIELIHDALSDESLTGWGKYSDASRHAKELADLTSQFLSGSADEQGEFE